VPRQAVFCLKRFGPLLQRVLALVEQWRQTVFERDWAPGFCSRVCEAPGQTQGEALHFFVEPFGSMLNQTPCIIHGAY
jgi:hypothetical protein